MCDLRAVSLLYDSVMKQDIIKFQLSEYSIKKAIQNMTEVYKPDSSSLSLSSQKKMANYNDAAHRCAYLHKYAPFHTAMTAHMLFCARLQNERIFQQSTVYELCTRHGHLNICSLGGGPGSDVLGVLSALNEMFGYFYANVIIVDCMEKWRLTFSYLIAELVNEDKYGAMSLWARSWYLKWSYLQCDLLNQRSAHVREALQSADLVTMVKFVSAAASKDTSSMISEIFDCLKPGALVLYIDNSGGGFHQLVQRIASKCHMTAVSVLTHKDYKNESFTVNRFGYTPCLQTKVSVLLLMKQGHRTKDIDLYRPVSVQPKQQVRTSHPNTVGNINPISARSISSVSTPNSSQLQRKESNRSANTNRQVTRMASSQVLVSRNIENNYNPYAYYQYSSYTNCRTLSGTPASVPNRKDSAVDNKENCPCCVIS